jgi:ribosomal protein L37AE/L43A
VPRLPPGSDGLVDADGWIENKLNAHASFECPKCQSVSHNPNDAANWYCARCHQFVEDMRDEQVTDFKHITDLFLTRRDCWTLALLTLTDCKLPAARLVHGVVTSSFTGKPILHAWCEMPATATYEDGSEGPITVVVDHTQIDPRAVIIPADRFVELTGARAAKRFTLDEAIAQALLFGHDGPWEKIN